jgi:hypothetical protein
MPDERCENFFVDHVQCPNNLVINPELSCVGLKVINQTCPLLSRSLSTIDFFVVYGLPRDVQSCTPDNVKL